jgi:toxin YoeB
MKWEFDKNAQEDLQYFLKTDKKILKRIKELFEDIETNPFSGKGKPEALKYNLSGKWSRRITQEHRLVYEVNKNTVIVYSCRYHY